MSEGASDLIGRTLGGRFRITAFLGEGAMASVFRAEQDAEPKDVAVKVMHRELLRDATFAKRFVREAKAAARIDHPNSVRILEHGADGDALYLAMELLIGQDLFDTLARENRLAEERAARIVIEACSALEYAHAQGIVHRDLKPENVMLVRDASHPDGERVKVLDFGIAKILERERSLDDPPPSSSQEPMSAPPSSVLTRVGTIVGTPEYMAPEQAMGLQVDNRSDVYSCGVLLYHTVTGKQPFSGASPIDVIVQVVDSNPALPSALAPEINKKLERIIMKAIAKLPDSRYQSARELRLALEALLPELGPNGRSAEPAVPAVTGPVIKALPGVPGAVTISNERKAAPDDSPSTVRSQKKDGEDPAPSSDGLAFAATMKSTSASEIADAIEAKRIELEQKAKEEAERKAAEEAEKQAAEEAKARADAAEKADAAERASEEAARKAEREERESKAPAKRPASAGRSDEFEPEEKDKGSSALFAASTRNDGIAPGWAIAAMLLIIAIVAWAMRALGSR